MIAVAFIVRKRKEQRAASRAPFDGLVRRPAGESLRIKLEELDDKLGEAIFGLMAFPLLLAMGLLYQHPKEVIAPLTYFVFSAGSSVLFGRRAYKLSSLHAKYRLGFEGERLVGEAISRLIFQGFEIYHDVPFDGFNLDHVMVGPHGVFVVETKTRSKPINKNGKGEYRVFFDGKCLNWPTRKADTYGIEQAKRNAKTLSGFLSSATGKNVWVTPILTVPGWMVELKAPCDTIFVLNPAQIYNFCSSGPVKLTEVQIQGICHQLDQKCRLELK